MDKTGVSKKFHKFMHPNIRKVFLPDDSDKVQRLDKALSASNAAHRETLHQLEIKTKLFTDARSALNYYSAQEKTFRDDIFKYKCAMAQVNEELQRQTNEHFQALKRETDKDALIASLKTRISELTDQVHLLSATNTTSEPGFTQDSTSSVFQFGSMQSNSWPAFDADIAMGIRRLPAPLPSQDDFQFQFGVSSVSP